MGRLRRPFLTIGEKIMDEINGYHFRDPSLLKTALTHTSYANENRELRLRHNQRLEFLGDSVLSILVSDYIYKNYPWLPEGQLTKIRATVVCEKTLASCAGPMGVGDMLYLGKGEALTGGRRRSSVLADAFEAILGAVYLDGGMEAAKNYLLPILVPRIKEAAKQIGTQDHKTTLQELVQKTPGKKIEYHIVDERGPDHNRIYEVEVTINKEVMGHGVGHSKKEAEQMAAKQAIEQWK